MNALTIFISLILAFSCIEVSAGHHKKKNIKHELPSIRGGHSKECGQPKQVNSAENRKKTDKKNRINEKKRDGYGACIFKKKHKPTPVPTADSGASRDRSPEYACQHKPKIVKQPRPKDWSESTG